MKRPSHLCMFLFISVLFSGCSLDSIVKVSEPEEGRSVNIKDVTTKSGALLVYASALGKLQKGVATISKNVSLFTDERAQPPGPFSGVSDFDSRKELRHPNTLRTGLIDNDSYENLNSARTTFSQLRDIIRNINDPSLSYLLSASYALEGYAVLMLAENFCSGIPLSKLTFDGTIQYEAGSSTKKILQAAVSLFDSSQTISHDSSRFNILARTGKGRAYLSLAMLDSAYESVKDINIQDAFYLSYTEAFEAGSTTNRPYIFWNMNGSTIHVETNRTGLINYEGTNGIQWFPNTGPIDKRLPMNIDTVMGNLLGRIHKYSSPVVQFSLANGMEKKMIESEYWLSISDPRWLNAINEARQSKGIQDTVDPGTSRAREDLLFRERALWFYLDGHRLADYRRLIRQYGRSPYEVYPVGIYEGGSGIETSVYGDAFVFSPSEGPNRKYQGCDHKNP